MDFWKFLNLLETKSLFFSNSDNLGDNNEGRIPHFILERMIEQDNERGNRNNQELNDYLESTLRKNHLISSWSYAERESFAMWKMYAKDKTGVAIETDLKSLQDSFNKTDRIVYVGEVNYINEDNYHFSTSNMFYPFVTKLDFYKFENEIRCVTITKDDEKPESKLVEVDLNTLIKKVHISPNSKPEFRKLIELLKNEYQLEFEICYSKVSDSWL
ncbi:DUF2971 domain-containing protein [Marixanthomonas sp. SCSIO 43207]|uniref:DUF2971 domain-containing protein n=1 Tax=Marixanthomonas sp. SCSIO 43207 TaxID=2779360 RepID=UPI001CA81218|nr:DUF2971 domain-containing protein [Marixanthomonas sp. SCSIO 43207]UAB82280.1 DUF2971 domain-containing protein [Marixanthomonas sp. SCSIO 43207]